MSRWLFGPVAAVTVHMAPLSSNRLTWFALIVLCMQLTACELAKGIFKAGVWVGVLGVVVVVGLVVWVLSRMRS